MNKYFILTIILFLLILFTNCSKCVYEDRKPCPCTLTFNLSNIKEVNNLKIWIFSSNNNLVFNGNIPDSCFGKEYKILVNREQTKYYIWANLGINTKIDNDKSINANIVKENYKMADSIYYCGGSINTNSEEIKKSIILYKEFINVKTSIIGSTETFHLQFKGNNNGFTINGKCREEEDIIKCQAKNKNLFLFRMLRQNNLDNLTLEIFKNNSYTNSLYAFPLGEWLKENGYDMMSQNLSDIEVLINLFNNTISIKTIDWEITKPIELLF